MSWFTCLSLYLLHFLELDKLSLHSIRTQPICIEQKFFDLYVHTISWCPLPCIVAVNVELCTSFHYYTCKSLTCVIIMHTVNV